MELFPVTKVILIRPCACMRMENTQDGQNHMELVHGALERAKTLFSEERAKKQTCLKEKVKEFQEAKLRI